MDLVQTSRTSVIVNKKKFQWEIENFSSYDQTLPLSSDIFTWNSFHHSLWRMHLRSTADIHVTGEMSNWNTIDVYIELKKIDMLQLLGNYLFKNWFPPLNIRISIGDSLGVSKEPSVRGKQFVFSHIMMDIKVGKPEKIPLIGLYQYLTKGVENLKVICEISHNIRQDVASQFDISPPTLEADYRELLLNSNYSDFIISAAGLEFKVHKCIIASRSPVFDAMIRADFKESRTGKVLIEEFSKDVIKEMLMYMYTGKCSLEYDTGGLLAAADKYGLGHLKNLCEAQLIKGLNDSNALHSFILGDLHTAKNLRTYAHNYVVDKFVMIVHKPEWQVFLREHPELTEELLKSVANGKSTTVILQDPRQKK